MKIPNRDKAVVHRNKLLKYLLSETHPVGSTKARFFNQLGFNKSNVDELEKTLLKIARTNNIKSVKKFEYGTNYVIYGSIETPSRKRVIITTVWFMKTATSKPSFVTAYPL